jgi:hypothetical protein
MPSNPTPPVPTPATPEYFDYPRVATEAGITPDQLHAIVQIFEADYPADLMLRELHILRACTAVKEGRTTTQAILADPSASSAA